MTALPSNLALVGDDLAHATFIDARRSLRRRRLATYAVAFALLALTGSAAVANGWLFGETPTVRAAPALAGGRGGGALAPGSGIAQAGVVAHSVAEHRAATPGTDNSPPLGAANTADSRTLLTGLGPNGRTLSVVTTTSGGVCVALTGFQVQCVPTFKAGQTISWFTSSPATGPTVVWGIARDDVKAIDAISAGGDSYSAEVGNDGFYVEIPDGPPARLIVHLADGTTDSVTPLPCPLTTPDCNP